MTIKWQDAALLLVAVFLLGWLLSHGAGPASEGIVHEKEIVREHVDTAHSVVDVPLHPFNVMGTTNHTRTITLHDTVFREACLDTLLGGDTTALAPDTLSVCYARDSFSVAVGFSPRRKDVAVSYLAHDTFYWNERSPPAYEGKAHAWYDDVLIVILSLAAGIIVGKL
jgi:hypothetical protein